MHILTQWLEIWRVLFVYFHYSLIFSGMMTPPHGQTCSFPNTQLILNGLGGPSQADIEHPNQHFSLTSLQIFSPSSKTNVIISTSGMVSDYSESCTIFIFSLCVKDCECIPLVLMFSGTCTHFIRLQVAKFKISPGMSSAAHTKIYHYQLCHK